jgi:Domain of Unknown Function (DUF1080)
MSRMSECILMLMLFALSAPALTLAADAAKPNADGWIALFDGKSLEGWTAGENKDSFKLEDGVILVEGPRGRLFYTGPVENHNFKDFELKLEVKTEPQANSGVYIHTKYQDSGWPEKGYEAQVNNSQQDWRKTGSLYAVKDVRDSGHEDGKWFEYHIIVKDDNVQLIVDGKPMVEYTEPENPPHLADMPGRKLSSGTIALQAHDPGSVIRYRNIRIKPLGD